MSATSLSPDAVEAGAVAREPLGAVATINRGVRIAPELSRGFTLTLLCAFGGAVGRVTVPILIQQAIDRGLRAGDVQVGVITVLGAIGLVVVALTAWSQRTAVARLGVRSEEALYGLRVRLFDHIHRLSLADHADERRGALVARVTSDIETLTQFFSWGGVAWLLDGTLMVARGGRDDRLRLGAGAGRLRRRGAVGDRVAPRAAAPGRRLRRGSREELRPADLGVGVRDGGGHDPRLRR